MNFTVNARLDSRTFPIEEDAYLMLLEYRKTISKMFSKSDDGDEIIADIDNRISEILCESVAHGAPTVTADHVKNVMRLIGTPDDIIDAESLTDSETDSRTPKPVDKRNRPSRLSTVCSVITCIIIGTILIYLGLNMLVVLVKMLFACFGVEIFRVNPLMGNFIINPALYDYNAAAYVLFDILCWGIAVVIPLSTLFHRAWLTFNRKPDKRLNPRTRKFLWITWIAAIAAGIIISLITLYCASHFNWDLTNKFG
ncbi:hypothetical protein [uncultured Muribaculum sp.]|uniref:hypothetical protein n=1 Tax=uncultured Muribaculum sp. TaxID=1918613 RepID=UPI0025E022A2|nr:hypothetical protein [uncultured Muribaculum sp.]